MTSKSLTCPEPPKPNEMPDKKRLTPKEEKHTLEIEKLRLELAELKKPAPTFWRRLASEWQATLITLLLAAVAIFPNYLMEQVKDGFNQADQRLVQFRQLSEDLGEHTFNGELWLEYFQNGWTAKEDLTPIVGDYNKSITTLRKREQLYQAVLGHYWDAAKVADFDRLMQQIKELDVTIHKMNSEAKLIVAGEEKKARPHVVDPILKEAEPQVRAISKNSADFLKALLQ